MGRVLPVARRAVATVIAAVVVTAAAAACSHHAPLRAGSVDFARYQRIGASQSNCSDRIAAGRIPRFTLPSGARYQATLTVSFRYSAHGSPGVKFAVQPGIAAPFKPFPPSQPLLQPKERTLAPTGSLSSSATVVSQVSSLFGGFEYRLIMQPSGQGCRLDPRTGRLDKYAIRLMRVVYTVHAWTR